MLQDTLIKKIMTKEVISLHPKDPMTKVREIFKTHNIHHIPVLDDEGCVVGIISLQDYNKLQNTFTFFKTSRSEEYNDAIMRSMLVDEVMTKQLATLHPDDSLKKASSYFKENRFHALPIIDGNKKLVGILTTFDLLNYAYDQVIFTEV